VEYPFKLHVDHTEITAEILYLKIVNFMSGNFPPANAKIKQII